MIKSLNTMLKLDKEKYEVPKSVQDMIPIRRIWPDGIFQVGNKFSKSIRFSDINYAIASKADKTEMFLDYSELLNARDTGATTKITINNKRINKNGDGMILDASSSNGRVIIRKVFNGSSYRVYAYARPYNY